MNLFSLTVPILAGEAATQALDAYIYGGIFAPPQIPRGIHRLDVTRFILDRLDKGDSPSAYAGVLRVMQFYELEEIAAEVVSRSATELEEPDDIRRACYITQIGAEFGKGDTPDRADRYLDTDILRSVAAARAFDILLETRVALAPRGTIDRLAARIQQEFARKEAEVEDEASLMAYDGIAAIVSNDLPRAARTMERKANILAMPDDERLRTLIQVYLGLDDISSASSEVWAGRLLRKQVIDGDQRVIERFGEILEPIDTLDGRSPADCFVFERLANAFAYLGGELSENQVMLASRIESPGVHFLADQPVGWLERRMAIPPR